LRGMSRTRRASDFASLIGTIVRRAALGTLA
jgi:hypothetical protein